MSPYWGKGFGDFFLMLLARIGQFLGGQLGWNDLAADEIQIGALCLIAFSSSLIGTFLVLRRMTMLANALSHTILVGIVVAFLLFGQRGMQLDLKTLFIAALASGLLTTLVTEWMHKGLKLQEDASIGLVFTFFFSLGIIGITLFSRNSHLGIEAIMGNVDALHLNDLKMTGLLFLLNSTLLLLFYKRYYVMTFDPTLARNFGIPVFLLNHVMMLQTAATTIGAFRALGVFLFLAFLVVPTVTARFFTSRLKSLLLLSCGIGVLASFLSVALARHLLTHYQISLSTAGLTTTVLGAFFLFGIAFRFVVRWRVLKHLKNDETKTDSPAREHRVDRPEYS